MEHSNKFSRLVVIVGLDQTEMDDYLIRYTHMLSRVLPIESIFFVHVAKTLFLPEEILKKYPDLLAPLDESIAADIEKKVSQQFGATQVSLRYIVTEGNPIDKLLHLARIKNPDLIIMGRKKNLKGSGIVSSNIARKSPCSLLLVTENSPREIKKILVPIDFSMHSCLAMKQAIRISEKTGAEILLAHIFEVPIGYYKSGKSFKAFAEIMKKHAEKDFLRFSKKNDLFGKFKCEFLLMENRRPDSLIYAYGKRHSIDFLVIGSKGRTRSSAVLIGSMAEKLVFVDKDIPVLISKKKGENMGFLKALMKI